MYSKDGNSYFIVDGHTHFWDGSPANQANRYGEGFIKCFYDYHPTCRRRSTSGRSRSSSGTPRRG